LAGGRGAGALAACGLGALAGRLALAEELAFAAAGALAAGAGAPGVRTSVTFWSLAAASRRRAAPAFRAAAAFFVMLSLPMGLTVVVLTGRSGAIQVSIAYVAEPRKTAQDRPAPPPCGLDQEAP
jgi:hypothetical protein